jgi:uncharacterized protein (DUF2141 family)
MTAPRAGRRASRRASPWPRPPTRRSPPRSSALPPGTYAVRAFQDVDENGKLNTNPFGLPVEPYGFSHDAQPNMGPPTFDAAAFEVKAGANAQAIHLK